MQEEFDPQKHVAKFCYEQRTLWRQSYLQSITGNLYSKELTIEIWNFQGGIVDTFGYSLENKMNVLLPLLKWENFEKLRDANGWDDPNHCGYRDGWFYRFVCMNESGNPMITRCLDVIFEKEHEPADERLIRWIKNWYANRSELKQYHLLW